MSFSFDIKEELCTLQPASCCLKAEAFGLFLFGRAFSANEISILTEQQCVANRYCTLIEELTGVIPIIRCSKAGNYKIRVEAEADRLKILTYFGYTGKEVTMRVNFSNFENTDEECCFKAFLRGAFLACGNITNPEKEYHLEFNISRAKLCQDLLKVMEETGLHAKRLTRGGGYVLYCKDAESIEDFLGTMGANNSFLFMMRTRAVKDMKNQVNRRTNFEAANLGRTIEAGMRQVEMIEAILEKITLHDMTDDLAALCRLRLDNPDLSLDELGKLMDKPLSRAAVSRRFKKLEAIRKEVEAR